MSFGFDNSAHAAWAVVGVASLAAWLYLTLLHGGFFWRGNFWREKIGERDSAPNPAPPPLWPEIVAVIPARDEAEFIGAAVTSLLTQDYPAPFSIVLVDDGSRDGTADAARAAARATRNTRTAPQAPTRLEVVTSAPKPPEWAGKVWAMRQGAAQAIKRRPNATYILFTDADIQHHASNLRELAARAEADHLDLASLMVRLPTGNFWERLLIPPFVFFFQKLYPFPWVNNPAKSTAAAAGGCMLVRRTALEASGGVDGIQNALIDDCALAAQLKHRNPAGGRLWLGLSDRTYSLRSYDGLGSVWNMVARGAFTQLRYSPLLLLGTVLGMSLLYLAPPLGLILAPFHGSIFVAIVCAAAWILMTVTAAPTYASYGQSWRSALGLPLAAALFTAMTVDSAWRYWRGRGGGWKGRTISR